MRKSLLLRGGSAAPETAAAAAAAAPPEVSRVIVFTNLRESVHSICELLAQHAPHVSAKCAPGSDKFWALFSLPTSNMHAFSEQVCSTSCCLARKVLQMEDSLLVTRSLYIVEDGRSTGHLINADAARQEGRFVDGQTKVSLPHLAP